MKDLRYGILIGATLVLVALSVKNSLWGSAIVLAWILIGFISVYIRKKRQPPKVVRAGKPVEDLTPESDTIYLFPIYDIGPLSTWKQSGQDATSVLFPKKYRDILQDMGMVASKAKSRKKSHFTGILYYSVDESRRMINNSFN